MVSLTNVRTEARRRPMGIHKKVARAAIGVGRKTKRPSWKTNGLGRSSGGTGRADGSGCTKYASCNSSRLVI